MGRVGIYIGNQEVVERYVGDKLVWKKERVRVVSSFVESTWIHNSSSNHSTSYIYSTSVLPTGRWYNAIIQRGSNRYNTSYVLLQELYGYDDYFDITIVFNTTNEWRRFKSDAGYGSNVRVEVLVPY